MSDFNRLTCEGLPASAISAAQEIISINLSLRGVRVALGYHDSDGNLGELQFCELDDVNLLHEYMIYHMSDQQEDDDQIVREPTEESLVQRRSHLFQLLDTVLK